jgi:hypothetical protein
VNNVVRHAPSHPHRNRSRRPRSLPAGQPARRALRGRPGAGDIAQRHLPPATRAIGRRNAHRRRHHRLREMTRRNSAGARRPGARRRTPTNRNRPRQNCRRATVRNAALPLLPGTGRSRADDRMRQGWQHGKVDHIAAQAGKTVSTIFSANPFGETCGPSERATPAGAWLLKNLGLLKRTDSGNSSGAAFCHPRAQR